MERVQKKQASHDSANSVRVAQGIFARNAAQSDVASLIDNSPRMTAQRRKLQGMFGGAAQLQGVEKEMVQGKFDTEQRVEEEEEPLQGKSETAQLQESEEEEPLQGKFATAQLQGLEEEEPLQGRFAGGEACAQSEEETSRPNNTGLPDNLKSGVESLSGMSMDNVKVHYNSSQPAQLNALAYTQGSVIHVAPGQEQHLPHEAWHVVQQAQGRVQPTMQMKDGVPVNDDAGLEHEADVMGGKAAAICANTSQAGSNVQCCSNQGHVQQLHANKLVLDSAKAHYADGWGARYNITTDNLLKGQVADNVVGSGSVNLGWFDGPEAEQNPEDRRFQKQCWIGYRDHSFVSNKTVIYHCGPSGAPHWY
jgi:hypothetical protein